MKEKKYCCETFKELVEGKFIVYSDTTGLFYGHFSNGEEREAKELMICPFCKGGLGYYFDKIHTKKTDPRHMNQQTQTDFIWHLDERIDTIRDMIFDVIVPSIKIPDEVVAKLKTKTEEREHIAKERLSDQL